MSGGIEARVTALIASTLRADAGMINRSTSIADELAADSMDFVTLILAIEEELNVDIHDDDAPELLTVGQLIDYVTLGLAIKEATVATHVNRDIRVPIG